MKFNYLSIALSVILAACTAQSGSDLDAKKQQLETAKKEAVALAKTISDLEKEIKAADPTFAASRNIVLISPVKLERKPFEHFIELRGTVESRRNVQLSAQMGGEIERVHVKEGQRVSKNQTLVSLNADVLRSSLGDLKSSYELAKTMYEKQAKLWEQKIGTEVQYLQAKNAMESLEKKMEATSAQIAQMMVKAPFNGTIDKVDALEGQMAVPGFRLVRMVNADDVYVSVDVSEDFIGKFKANDKAELYFPAQDKKISSIVSSVGQVINPENRTFDMEIKLPSGMQVQPNQVSSVTLRDYVNTKAFSLPTKLIQRDNQGQFVYVIGKDGNKNIARKQYISIGVSYAGTTEITEGLTGEETIIGEGFRDVAEGIEVNIAAQQTAEAAPN
jgi:RND family efflux transporter MFP subunit